MIRRVSVTIEQADPMFGTGRDVALMRVTVHGDETTQQTKLLHVTPSRIEFESLIEIYLQQAAKDIIAFYKRKRDEGEEFAKKLIPPGLNLPVEDDF